MIQDKLNHWYGKTKSKDNKKNSKEKHWQHIANCSKLDTISIVKLSIHQLIWNVQRKNKERINYDSDENENSWQSFLGKCYDCRKTGHEKDNCPEHCGTSYEEKQSWEQEEESAEVVLYAISETESPVC